MECEEDMKRTISVLGLAALAACGGVDHQGLQAASTLRPLGDSGASGEVTFIERSNGRVLVVARFSGLRPYAEHGFHVHERGDCNGPDAPGGHFNPKKLAHGHLGVGGRHAGDLPNLRTDARGRASTSIEVNTLSVKEGERSVLGRSVVVHAMPDDYRSEPAGNSGPAIACGVVQKAGT